MKENIKKLLIIMILSSFFIQCTVFDGITDTDYKMSYKFNYNRNQMNIALVYFMLNHKEYLCDATDVHFNNDIYYCDDADNRLGCRYISVAEGVKILKSKEYNKSSLISFYLKIENYTYQILLYEYYHKYYQTYFFINQIRIDNQKERINYLTKNNHPKTQEAIELFEAEILPKIKGILQKFDKD